MKNISLLKKILLSLVGVRQPAEGFLIVLEEGNVDESFVATLIELLRETMKKMKNSQGKEKLSKTMNLLLRIQEEEKAARLVDEKDAEELLNQLYSLS